VATGATIELQVTVTVPPATPIGQFEQLSVTVRSSSDPSAVQTVTLTTIAGRALYFPFAGR
jgi:hypothetical protein